MQNPVGRACALYNHYPVGATNVFPNIKVHVGKLKLAIVVPYDKLDLVLASFSGFGIRHNIAAPVHTKNLNLHILHKLQLGIIQRNKRYL